MLKNSIKNIIAKKKTIFSNITKVKFRKIKKIKNFLNNLMYIKIFVI